MEQEFFTITLSLMKLIIRLFLSFFRLLAVPFIYSDEQINDLFQWLSSGEWEEDDFQDVYLK